MLWSQSLVESRELPACLRRSKASNPSSYDNMVMKQHRRGSIRRLLFLRLWTTTCRRSKTPYPVMWQRGVWSSLHWVVHITSDILVILIGICLLSKSARRIPWFELGVPPLPPFLGSRILPSRFPELFVALLWFFVSLSPPLFCLPGSAARRDDELPDMLLSLCPLFRPLPSE